MADVTSDSCVWSIFTAVPPVLLALSSYIIVAITGLFTVYVSSVKPLVDFSNGSFAASQWLKYTTPEGTACKLWTNTFIIIGFALLHSILARNEYFRSFTGHLHRVIYNMSTCAYILVGSLWWSSIPNRTLWELSSHEDWVVKTFAVVHVLAWACIMLSLLCFSHTELLGLPQVLYGSAPLAGQSDKLRRMYSHMRHPVWTLPCVVLWAVPVMTFDRMVLGVFLPLYLLWGCGLDKEDREYTRGQLARKVNKICYNVDCSED